MISGIEIDFRKSSYSPPDNADCVMVADLAGGARLVADSKLGPASPVLLVGAGSFGAVLEGIRAGSLV